MNPSPKPAIKTMLQNYFALLTVEVLLTVGKNPIGRQIEVEYDREIYSPAAVLLG
jgi:hypothetical protein